jgi:hypothetical protein
MKKLLLATAIAALFSTSAMAQNSPGPGAAVAAPLPQAVVAPSPVLYTKAPSAIGPSWLTGYPYGSSGLYVGLFTEAGGGPVNATVPGVNSASLTTTTAGIGAAVGYAWGSRSSLLAYAVEGKVSATNFNGANQGFSVAGPLSAEATGLVWMPVSLIQSTFGLLNLPNPFSSIAPFPLLPTGIAATNIQAGFGAGVRMDDVTIAYLGAGSNKVELWSPKIEIDLMEQLSNGSAIREYIETVFQGNGAVTGGPAQVKAVLGTKYIAGVMVAF